MIDLIDQAQVFRKNMAKVGISICDLGTDLINDPGNFILQSHPRKEHFLTFTERTTKSIDLINKLLKTSRLVEVRKKFLLGLLDEFAAKIFIYDTEYRVMKAMHDMLVCEDELLNLKKTLLRKKLRKPKHFRFALKFLKQ